MTRFKTREIEIEALRYTGDNSLEMKTFTNGNFSSDEYGDAEVWDYLHVTWVPLKVGDWIIQGTHGEFYPCVDDVFRHKYEEVK